MTNEMYWFARGYYDGRAKGSDHYDYNGTKEEHAVLRHSYRVGYDAGVTDYCNLDLFETE